MELVMAPPRSLVLIKLGLLVALFVALASAQLSRKSKQRLLDLHNEVRSEQSAENMLAMEWINSLSSEAEIVAGHCSQSPPDQSTLIKALMYESMSNVLHDGVSYSWIGMNRHFISSNSSIITLDHATETFWYWYNGTTGDDSTVSKGQILYPKTHILGCGAHHFSVNDRCHALGVGILVVCLYAPGFVTNFSLTIGESCPTEALERYNNLCSNSSQFIPSVPANDGESHEHDPIEPILITSIDNNEGSYAGGTLVTLHGQGFAEDQFNMDDPNLGNKVIFTNEKTNVTCDVLTHYTTSDMIKCVMGASPQRVDGKFRAVVSVDGKEVVCEEFHFNYRSSATPYITRVSPDSIVPGVDDNVTMIGGIYTYKVSESQAITEKVDSSIILERLLIGGQLCDPWDKSKNAAYGGYSNGAYGNVTCRPKTNRIDSMNATVVLSNYGLSQISITDLAIDNKLRRYVFQTHPDITGVEPNTGSIEGGTLITIFGKHFHDLNGDVKAYVSGVPCHIVNYTADYITCITGPAPPTTSFYPGGRGLVREVWTSDETRNLTKIKLRPHDYPSGTNWSIQDRAFRDYPEFGEGEHFNQRYSGFFVPPIDSNYSFNVIADDLCQLYLSPNASRDHMSLVVDVSRHAMHWVQYDYQISDPVYLKAGESYYMEAVHWQNTGPWRIGIGAKIHNLSWTEDVADIDYEEQTIRITSTVVDETQDVSIMAKPKIQVISIVNDPDINYTLSFNNHTTSPLSSTDNDTVINEALNSLQSIKDIGGVFVQTETESNILELSILFKSINNDSLSLIEAHGSFFNSSIVQELELPMSFSLSFVRRRTQSLPVYVSASELKEEIIGLFSTNCNVSNPGNIFFKETYEVAATHFIGALDNSAEPYCGHYSLRRPLILWKYDESWEYFSVSEYGNRYVCFAYRGLIPDSKFQLTVSGDKSDIDVPLDLSYNEDEWNYTCVDIYSDAINGKQVYEVKFTSRNNRLWIDEFAITNDTIEVQQTMLAARPNGNEEIFVKEVGVTNQNITKFQPYCTNPSNLSSCYLPYTKYTIKYQVYFCRYNMPLITSYPSLFTNVSRVLEGTPPVTGSFSLTFENHTVHDIIAWWNRNQMKKAIEDELPNEGGFTVTRSGHCSGYSWKVKWNMRPGDHPLMSANGEKLRGHMARVDVIRSVDGGVWMRPLRGDMLRLPELTPQVQVLVNGIPASCCNRNCSFNFTANSTPNITGIFPTLGGQDGTPLHIYGSGFGNNEAKATVKIGSNPCTVVSMNNSWIECQPQASVAGVRRVSVFIDGVGYAASSDEESILFTHSLSISSVDPEEGSISGGNEVTLTGAGFPLIDNASCYCSNCWPCNNATDSSSSSLSSLWFPNIYVTFGGYPCLIISSNLTELTCKPQQHEPDLVNVSVIVNGVETVLSDGYEYDINSTAIVSSIDPSSGPIFGGTNVTINGQNLLEAVSVSISGSVCDITSVSESNITCVTSRSVSPPGAHAVIVRSDAFGVALPQYLIDEPELLTEGALTLSQLMTNDSHFNDYDLFQNDSIVNFTYVFAVNSIGPCNGSMFGGTILTIQGEGFAEGVSVFIMTNSDERNCMIMESVQYGEIQCEIPSVFDNGTITDSSISSAVSVRYGNIEAHYDLDSNDTGLDDVDDESCYFMEDEGERPVFFYSERSTPIVSSIDPVSITLQSVITLRGSGFGTNSTSTRIVFGNCHCIIQGMYSDSMINCTLSLSCQPMPFTLLPLSLGISNKGYAVISGEQKGVTVKPVITGFSPLNGSLLGGNMLAISGYSFIENNNLTVHVDIDCEIRAVSYDTIECIVPRSTNSHMNLSFASVDVTYFSDEEVPCEIIDGDCYYDYMPESTPMIEFVSQLDIEGNETTLIKINGSLLSAETIVWIGHHKCRNITMEGGQNITCLIGPIQAGEYKLTVLSPGYGYAMFKTEKMEIISLLEIESVSPTNGSTRGGSLLTLSGYGFSSSLSNNSVNISGEPCLVIDSSYTSLTCITPDLNGEHIAANIEVVVAKMERFNNDNLTFTFSNETTPKINRITLERGLIINLKGTGFSTRMDDVSVIIGSSVCTVTDTNLTNIQCILGPAIDNDIGTYEVNVTIKGKGRADSVEYSLLVSEVSPMNGSFAGMNNLTVYGIGFDPVATTIKICGRTCYPSSERPSLTSLSCIIPSFTDLMANATTRTCNITVTSLSKTFTLMNSYKLAESLTPRVNFINSTRGSTAGGSILLIEGDGFSSNVTVTIAEAECIVKNYSETFVICQTGSSGRTVRAPVMVYVEGKGYAVSDNESIGFHYVDLWSTAYTWIGGSLPREGDTVIIPSGQTLVLDMRTQVLKMVLIKGGELIFDDKNGVELHSETILITNGGKLQVGTEESPYQNETQIVLYGHRLSTELPLFGAKTIAVRNGTLDLHGRPIVHTWTCLSSTAYAGNTTLYLKHNVSDWKVEDKIVLASTSYSPSESEELTIKLVSGDTIEVYPPLNYTHLSVTLTYNNSVSACAEVGHLTRNVVIRGNKDDWEIKSVNCPVEYVPGRFRVQSCFGGRFDPEVIADEFGLQITLHEGPYDEVIGRIEYIEVTQAGQAYRLGHYPILFRYIKDTSKSYMRGCAINNTFNRAVGIDGVHDLLIESNVAYNVNGHAFFMEDGAETNNTIRYNIGLSVKTSSSLLNIDITPATYWITNPSNTLSYNAAAGGSYIGFWYHFPTVLNDYPMDQFYNNSAHSFDLYGLWVDGEYDPESENICESAVTPAVFDSFVSWRNSYGVMFSNVGAVHLTNSAIIENDIVGVDFNAAWGERSGLIKNVLIVAHFNDTSEVDDPSVCTSIGLRTPLSSYVTVSGVTFVNFNEDDCYALGACSNCLERQGGYETLFEEVLFIACTNRVHWQWEHEQIFRDIDGSLTGEPGGALIPTSGVLPSSHCRLDNTSIIGSVCDPGIEFVRFTLFNPIPSFENLTVSSEDGSTVIPKSNCELGPGYMALLPTQQIYELSSVSWSKAVNISYNSLYSGINSSEYLWIRHSFSELVNVVEINGKIRAASSDQLLPGETVLGDWYINGTVLTYYANATLDAIDSACPKDVALNFSSYRCFYKNCASSPPSPPPSPSPSLESPSPSPSLESPSPSPSLESPSPSPSLESPSPSPSLESPSPSPSLESPSPSPSLESPSPSPSLESPSPSPSLESPSPSPSLESPSPSPSLESPSPSPSLESPSPSPSLESPSPSPSLESPSPSPSLESPSPSPSLESPSPSPSLESPSPSPSLESPSPSPSLESPSPSPSLESPSPSPSLESPSPSPSLESSSPSPSLESPSPSPSLESSSPSPSLESPSLSPSLESPSPSPSLESPSLSPSPSPSPESPSPSPTVTPSPGPSIVMRNWSDTSIWPESTLPVNDADVHIECNFSVLVDIPLPRLNKLRLCGKLEFIDDRDHVLEATRILIDGGGQLVAGSKDTPFQHQLLIILNGNHSSPQYHQGPVLGAKVLVVFGHLSLHGRVTNRSWTVLASTASPGETELVLAKPVDWVAGEEIVISPSYYEANETEVHVIKNISGDKHTLTLQQPLAFTHLGGLHNKQCCRVNVSVEVGLLTRNIKILGTHPNATLEEESYGCRVLVGSYSNEYTGSAALSGVEFKGCGQQGGFVEDSDPRFSLSFVNVGTITDSSSYIESCSFHRSYSTGIGVTGTNNLTISGNVVYRSIGPSIQIAGRDHQIINNLALMAVPNDPLNSEWTANFDLVKADNFLLVGNSAAGGGKSGYHTNGENCLSEDFVPSWSDNTAHSTLHGLHMGYSDGHTSGELNGCSSFHRFTIYSCYHYGFFSYSSAGIRITESLFVNNYAATFTAVIGPDPLTHLVGNKSVVIKDTLITSSLYPNRASIDCTEYRRKPDIAFHKTSHSGIQSPQGGHVGVVLPSFTAGPGDFPSSAWSSVTTYPAINGLTKLSNVTFCHFGTHCGLREAAIISNPSSEDCQHPLWTEDVHFEDGTGNAKFYNHNPNPESINPADCGDMDCDGLKKILIRDIDGSFLGREGLSSLVSKSQLQSNGHGSSDYAIPYTALWSDSKTNLNGSYPHEGIYRGTNGECEWNPDYNSYLCANIDHMMLVIESLDPDTEVRRFAPVGVSADGYIDLINGPKDHGWCGGYTCQERISTFYAIVSTGLNYTIRATGTNPQRANFMLLHASDSQSLRIAYVYNDAQRLDVYVGSEYIVPTNRYWQDGSLQYRSGGENFIPSISDPHGTNYYDKNENTLYIVIRGSSPVRVEAAPIVQLGINFKQESKTLDKTKLIEGLTSLLGIQPDQLQNVNIISGEGNITKRSTTNAATTRIEIEIGHVPLNETTVNNTDIRHEEYEELANVSTRSGLAIQTRKLSTVTGYTVLDAQLTEPQPLATDPTGGMRATNKTGGPQPGDSGTDALTTYSERQRQEEERRRNETRTVTLSIPHSLRLLSNSTDGKEGVTLTSPPLVAMYDESGSIVNVLGVGQPWQITAHILEGPRHTFLINNTVDMGNGMALFSGLIFSHPGSYKLMYNITYPPLVNFTVLSPTTISVIMRQLKLFIMIGPPQEANTTFPLPHPLVVHVLDMPSGELAANLGWRKNRAWYMKAHLIMGGSITSVLISGGVAKFPSLHFRYPGTYRIRFSVYTDPESPSSELPDPIESEIIEVSRYQVTCYIIVYGNNYDEVVEGHEESLASLIVFKLKQFYPNVHMYNATISNGSIVVSLFATSSNLSSLLFFVETLPGSAILRNITFRGHKLVLLSITQDPNYPVTGPTAAPTTESTYQYLIVTVVTSTVGGVMLLVIAILTVAIVAYKCTRKRQRKRNFQTIDRDNLHVVSSSTIHSNTPIFDEAENDYPIFHLVSKGCKNKKSYVATIESKSAMVKNPSKENDEAMKCVPKDESSDKSGHTSKSNEISCGSRNDVNKETEAVTKL